MKPKQARIVQPASYEERGTYTRTPYPVIRLGGRFLEKLGFSIGDSIQIDYQPRKIVITKGEPCDP